jgi:hypothetical protein
MNKPIKQAIEISLNRVGLHPSPHFLSEQLVLTKDRIVLPPCGRPYPQTSFQESLRNIFTSSADVTAALPNDMMTHDEDGER